MLKKWKPPKASKGQHLVVCYIDWDKQFAIAYDDLQWITKRVSHFNYYKNMEHLFLDALEAETKEIIGHDIKTLLPALKGAQKRIEKLAKAIKLPEAL